MLTRSSSPTRVRTRRAGCRQSVILPVDSKTGTFANRCATFSRAARKRSANARVVFGYVSTGRALRGEFGDLRIDPRKRPRVTEHSVTSGMYWNSKKFPAPSPRLEAQQRIHIAIQHYFPYKGFADLPKDIVGIWALGKPLENMHY
jgi:hypothetical protein